MPRLDGRGKLPATVFDAQPHLVGDLVEASRGAVLVLDRRTGAVIGTSRFHGYDPERSEVEIGWTFLARSHWGGLYNRELKALMLGHAFRFVRTVVFLVQPRNVRSQRAVEKLGAVRIGERFDASGKRSLAYSIARPVGHDASAVPE